MRPGSFPNAATRSDQQQLARSAVAGLPAPQPDVDHAPGFPIVSIVLRIVFHCSCAGGVSPALAMACIVIGANFPLQIDCIFVPAGLGWTNQLRATACGRDASAESTAPTGTSVGIGFVRRGSESGCIEFDSECSGRIDDRCYASRVTALSRQRRSGRYETAGPLPTGAFVKRIGRSSSKHAHAHAKRAAAKYRTGTRTP